MVKISHVLRVYYDAIYESQNSYQIGARQVPCTLYIKFGTDRNKFWRFSGEASFSGGKTDAAIVDATFAAVSNNGKMKSIRAFLAALERF